MGKKSPFTAEKNAYIDSFMDAFVAKIESGASKADLTKWKQNTATHIHESALFLDLDLNKYTKRNWFDVS